MVSFIFKLIIIYLIYRLFTILLHKAMMYYRAYLALKMKQREHAVRYAQDVNLKAFDVEDAKFEEIKPGSED